MENLTRRTVLGISATFGLSIGTLGSALAEDYKWPAYFSVVTPVVGSGNHSLAVAWTTEFTAQTGVRIAIKPAPNGYARLEWLSSGEGEISLMQASEYFDQMDAVEGFMTREGGPSDTRVATMNLITPLGLHGQGRQRPEGLFRRHQGHDDCLHGIVLLSCRRHGSPSCL